MVYCPKCGTENDDNALVCKNCQANLRANSYRRRRDDDQCFGSESNSYIWGLLFGLLVIIWGLSSLLGDIWSWIRWDQIWPFMIIIVGVFIVYNSLTRR